LRICNAQIQRDTGLWYSAEYSTFSISDEVGNYQLTVAGYSGDAGDALANANSWRLANGMMFSTRDSDSDTGWMNCASDYYAGWWYSECTASVINRNINGIWGDIDTPLYMLTSNVLASRMLVKII